MNGTSQGCARLFLLVIASLLATNAVALMGQPHQVQRLPFVGSRVPVSSYVITHVYPHDRHARHHERWFRLTTIPRPPNPYRNPSSSGHRRRYSSSRPERVGMGEWGDLRERVADRLRRADLANVGTSARMD